MLSVDNDTELREAKTRLLRENSSGWVMCNYVSPTTIHYVGGGQDINEIETRLVDDQIQYVLTKVDNKDVLINWEGPKASIIEKGKLKVFHSGVEEILQPFHKTMTTSNRSDFKKDVINSRIQ